MVRNVSVLSAISSAGTHIVPPQHGHSNHTNSTHYLTSKNLLLLQNFTTGVVYDYILMDNHFIPVESLVCQLTTQVKK